MVNGQILSGRFSIKLENHRLRKGLTRLQQAIREATLVGAVWEKFRFQAESFTGRQHVAFLGGHVAGEVIATVELHTWCRRIHPQAYTAFGGMSICSQHEIAEFLFVQDKAMIVAIAIDQLFLSAFNILTDRLRSREIKGRVFDKTDFSGWNGIRINRNVAVTVDAQLMTKDVSFPVQVEIGMMVAPLPFLS